MAIMSIIHVAAVHWSEQKFIIIIRGGARAGPRIFFLHASLWFFGYLIQRRMYKH